ncbi:MAG: hypothetical protein DRP56_09810 [Planctomycetota bacterium]|nr:MAG: hypothetical protein DRP56_09810 [Planctomycetota bacterium]
MNDWLIKSKNQFQEHILDFLWQQWGTLGIAGVSKSKNHRIIDPEALLLFSLSVCRYEPRLFDEIIDWLFQNGQFINVQRLQQIQKKYDFHCGPQLSAIAELLSKKSSYKLKWSGLAEKYYQKPTEPLFFDKDRNPLPCPEDKDVNHEFINHGLRRGSVNLRGYSQSFDLYNPACLLLRLRALLGINARAEILCLLASAKEVHPSEAARRTAYYQKTVQTTLVEMSQSGVILTRTSKKEKFYRLKPDILDTLLKPNGKPPTWINWPDFLKIVETIWLKTSKLSTMTIDPLLLISELKKLMQSIYENHLNTDIDEIIIDSNIRVEDFTKIFQEKLRLISGRLIL